MKIFTVERNFKDLNALFEYERLKQNDLFLQ